MRVSFSIHIYGNLARVLDRKDEIINAIRPLGFRLNTTVDGLFIEMSEREDHANTDSEHSNAELGRSPDVVGIESSQATQIGNHNVQTNVFE